MPDTEAGKRLSELIGFNGHADPAMDDYIDAIEVEAVAAERARIKRAVEGLRNPYRNHGGVGQGSAYGSGWEEARAAVLAIIDGGTDAED